MHTGLSPEHYERFFTWEKHTSRHNACHVCKRALLRMIHFKVWHTREKPSSWSLDEKNVSTVCFVCSCTVFKIWHTTKVPSLWLCYWSIMPLYECNEGHVLVERDSSWRARSDWACWEGALLVIVYLFRGFVHLFFMDDVDILTRETIWVGHLKYWWCAVERLQVMYHWLGFKWWHSCIRNSRNVRISCDGQQLRD